MMMISSEANLLTNTNWASQHVLSLPVQPLITEMDIERIADNFNKAFKNLRLDNFIRNILTYMLQSFYS